jgi:hypothetical protein
MASSEATTRFSRRTVTGLPTRPRRENAGVRFQLTKPEIGAAHHFNSIVGDPLVEFNPTKLVRGRPCENLSLMAAVQRKRRALLNCGVVLTLDPQIGDFAKADMLIEHGKIHEISPTIAVSEDTAP